MNVERLRRGGGLQRYCTVPVPGLYRFEHTGGSGTTYGHTHCTDRFTNTVGSPFKNTVGSRDTWPAMLLLLLLRARLVLIHVTEPCELSDESLRDVNELSGLFDAQKHGDRASSPPAV